MESEDHYQRKRYLAFLSGGYVEVLGPFNRYYDASSFSGLIFFEYERHKNRYRYAAEKLHDIINERSALGILVVQDDEKEEAIKIIGNDFPGIKIYSKSEMERIFPGLLPVVLENVARRQKEFRLKRRLFLQSDLSPRDKVIALIQNAGDRIQNILFGRRNI